MTSSSVPPAAAQPAWRPSAASPLRRAATMIDNLSRRDRHRLRVLSVVHAGSGGTINTNEDLMRALTPEATPFILATGPRKWVLYRVTNERIDRVEEIVFSDDWRGHEPVSLDRKAAFSQALKRHRISVVHFRSLLGSGGDLVELAKQQACAVVVSLHDFLAICPNIQLLDSSLIHCAGACTSGENDCASPAKWFAGIPRLKHAYVHNWRTRMADTLALADAVVATTEIQAALLRTHFSSPLTRDRLRIIEHGRDEARSVAARVPGEQVRVVALNIIEPAKGRALLSELMRLNDSTGTRFEIHLLGEEGSSQTGRRFHGKYLRQDLPAKLAEIGPSFSLIPSLGPETYCHTLTESWLAGIPVLASNLGALRERIERDGGGWLLDPREPEAWLRTLSSVSDTPTLWHEKAEEIARMRFRTRSEMASDYLALYQQLVQSRDGGEHAS